MNGDKAVGSAFQVGETQAAKMGSDWVRMKV